MNLSNYLAISKRSVAAVLILSAVGSWQLRAEPATQPVEDAIAHLGDSDPVVRGQAIQTLRQAGSAARAALEAAAAGEDPEIAARAKDILRTAADAATIAGVTRDPPIPEILDYHTTPAAEKQEKINEIATRPRGIAALTKIWLIETDPVLRRALFDQFVEEPSKAAGAFLGDGNVATAEVVLQAAVDRKIDESPRAYAAYWLSRGKLDEAIRRWSSRGGQQPPDAWAEQVLAVLYRAKGDAKAALEHAQASDDGDVLQETLLWAGEWAQLANKLRQDNPAVQEPSDMALIIGVDSMAGDGKAVDADVAHLGALVHDGQQAEAAADILLLIGRPDDAVKILLDAGGFAPAYEILQERGKFDEAVALLAAHDADSTEEALRLRAAAAWGFGRLGPKKRCAEMADRVAKENENGKFPRVYASLAEAERQGKLTDKAWPHFFAAIESADENSIQWYVNRAFPAQGNTIDWTSLWTASVDLKPDRLTKDLFTFVRGTYDKSIPLDDLTAAVHSTEPLNEMSRPFGELLWEAARRTRAAGRDADAIKLVEQAAASARDGDLYVHLGDWAVEKKDWTLAANRYEAAWRKDRTQALPLYLQGWALEKSGKGAEGREHMAMAHLLPVGDEIRRSDFIRGLYIRRIDDAAAREADVLIRTGDPLSSSSQEALRMAAEHAEDHGDFAMASALLQRWETDYLTVSYWFENHAQYLHLPYEVRDSHARAMIAVGDWDGAQREIRACLDLLPLDSSIAIDVVPELDKHGRRDEADALFAKVFATQQTLCDRYPDSAFQLNEYAWLAAKCHRELDKALDAARRAVALDPKSAEAIDTLAEVYFQRGEFQNAIVEEKKCIELSPDIPFHHKQVERFEEAARK